MILACRRPVRSINLEMHMSEISRRALLADAAVAPALALQTVEAPPERHLLASRYTPASLVKVLQPRSQWHPYPQAADSNAWDQLPGALRDGLVASAAKSLGVPYPPLPATLFLEYVRTGNRSHYEAVNSVRRRHLREAVLAECVDRRGRFLDDIADGIWTICEETFWGYPAHLSLQKKGSGLPDVTEPVIDLFAAETGALLAWADYLLGSQLDKVHKMVRERMALELERRILAVYRDRSDFWWMGLDGSRSVNNWNPWINSNCLAVALLMDDDASRRARTVHKILTSLDRFLDSYHDDGGCDEGPSYWSRAGASLFDNLDLLHSASGGAIDYYSIPLVREIGRYIYRAHIAGIWFVNFADASARIQIDGDLVYRYGRAIGDPDMQAFGAWAARQSSNRGDSLGRMLPALFNAGIGSAEARQPLVRDVWLSGIQVAAARLRHGSAEGFYFAAQGGHNAESHNHNDVGNFIVFLNGEPVLIDVGVETYSAKTFSPRRYEIWTMRSSYHNVPTINGVEQSAGRRFAARDAAHSAGDSRAEFSVDIAAAYPGEAQIDKWHRAIRLDRRDDSIHILDNFTFKSIAGRVDMNFMTPRDVVAGEGVLRTGAVRISYAGPSSPEVKVEPIEIQDARLHPVWGDRVFRTILSWRDLPRTGQLRFDVVKSGA
jgi:hypothetical protein